MDRANKASERGVAIAEEIQRLEQDARANRAQIADLRHERDLLSGPKDRRTYDGDHDGFH